MAVLRFFNNGGRFFRGAVWPKLGPTEQALARSQQGPMLALFPNINGVSFGPAVFARPSPAPPRARSPSRPPSAGVASHLTPVANRGARTSEVSFGVVPRSSAMLVGARWSGHAAGRINTHIDDPLLNLLGTQKQKQKSKGRQVFTDKRKKGKEEKLFQEIVKQLRPKKKITPENREEKRKMQRKKNRSKSSEKKEKRPQRRYFPRRLIFSDTTNRESIEAEKNHILGTRKRKKRKKENKGKIKKHEKTKEDKT